MNNPAKAGFFYVKKAVKHMQALEQNMMNKQEAKAQAWAFFAQTQIDTLTKQHKIAQGDMELGIEYTIADFEYSIGEANRELGLMDTMNDQTDMQKLIDLRGELAEMIG